MSAKRFVPTTPDKWPRAPVELELPSGALVLAKRPNLFVWHRTGQMPDEIWATIVASVKDEEISAEDRIEAINWIIAKCLVAPEVSLVPREGALCIDEIDDVDREHLMLSLGIGLG